MKALVVDNSTVMRKVVIGALSRAGITDVDQAADGEEVLELAEENGYGLILMDTALPGINGIQALRELRKRGDDTPVILMSTEKSQNQVTSAAVAGADGYVFKPIEPHEFVTRIREVLAKRDED